MSNKKQEGGCQCGAVRYQTTDSPVWSLACHCTTCKQRTGAAFGIGVYFREEQIEFLRGELITFEFHSDQSGRWIRNEFCQQCATTVSWTLEMRPGIRAIAGGSYDNPDWFALDAHIWTQSARTDMTYAEGMTVYPKGFPKK